MKTKTILATCYAVNPYKGSEDAMGWNYTYQIARHQKVISITRENNQAAIEKYMKENPDPVYKNISFFYFDLPYSKRFWKKKLGTVGAMIYYYLWQKNVIHFIKNQQITFDICHNVNFHNDWTPSFLYQLKKPMVWGPIGHHPLIPTQYLRNYSAKYFLQDRLTWLIKNIFWKTSPALKKTIQHANHIWCMNSGVAKILNLKNKQYAISPSIASEDFALQPQKKQSTFNLISVGRFVPLKGFDLTIASYADFLNKISLEDRNKCLLTLVGTGPEKDLYIKMIQEFNIGKHVEIIEWIDRIDLMKIYEKSAAFLFPSHEGAGMVVAEALSFGLPVICLDNEGPGEFIHNQCGFKIKHASNTNTITELSKAILQLYQSPILLDKMSKMARLQYENVFTWNSRGEKLNEIYNNLL